jgi:hypothetical protein
MQQVMELILYLEVISIAAVFFLLGMIHNQFNKKEK